MWHMMHSEKVGSQKEKNFGVRILEKKREWDWTGERMG